MIRDNKTGDNSGNDGEKNTLKLLRICTKA